MDIQDLVVFAIGEIDCQKGNNILRRRIGELPWMFR